MGHVSTPMLLAKFAVLTGARLLRNLLVLEVDLAFAFGSFLSISLGLPRRFGGFLKLLDVFESLDRVAEALRNNALGQVKLILPLGRAHP